MKNKEKKEVKKGTLWCKLFGHKFHATKVKYLPHYRKLIELGQATIMTENDFYSAGFKTDYCVRCGHE